VVLLSAVSALRLTAQSPPDRRALGAFRDSLAALTDTADLASLAAQYEGVATGDSTEALARIRAGFVRLRSGKPALAEKDFRRAARLEPAWPVPWLGLGDAHAAQGQITLENRLNLGTRPGLGEFRQAADAYGRSLQLDPSFTPGIEGELRLAVERRDTALLATAVAHAHQLPTAAATQEFLVALSRAEWRMGNVQAAQTALQAVPSDQATPAVKYELARTLLAGGDAYGEFYYWHAVAADDPAMLLMLRRDMALIATPEELAVFDSTAAPSRPDYLHRFWGPERTGICVRPGSGCRNITRASPMPTGTLPSATPGTGTSRETCWTPFQWTRCSTVAGSSMSGWGRRTSGSSRMSRDTSRARRGNITASRIPCS